MKTVALIVLALAIAFAAFRVGANFEQQGIEQCAAAIQKRYEDEEKTFLKAAVNWVDATMAGRDAGPKPERGMTVEAKFKAIADCGRGRIFVLN